LLEQPWWMDASLACQLAQPRLCKHQRRLQAEERQPAACMGRAGQGRRQQGSNLGACLRGGWLLWGRWHCPVVNAGLLAHGTQQPRPTSTGAAPSSQKILTRRLPRDIKEEQFVYDSRETKHGKHGRPASQLRHARCCPFCCLSWAMSTPKENRVVRGRSEAAAAANVPAAPKLPANTWRMGRHSQCTGCFPANATATATATVWAAMGSSTRWLGKLRA